MTRSEYTADIHDLDVTVWVGKSGISSVVDELASQLVDRDLVKVRFHRSALAGTTARDLAVELGDAVEAEIIDVRGHTAVYVE